MKYEITFTLNGVKRTAAVSSGETLLETIRGKTGVKSPKCGCDRGDCGTCTIFFNGKTVRSCLILAVEADGAEITTLEGISAKGPTKLQKAFAKRNSFQCGFCAPGVTLTAEELLKKNPQPSRREIQEALTGNLCRCTGYTPIIEAIEAASKGS